MTRISALLRDVYRPRYVALNLAVFVAYYLASMVLVRLDNSTTILFAPYARLAFYAVMVTGSVMFTLAVYSIRNTRNNAARYTSSAAGTVTAVGSGLFVGCGCQAPLALSVFSVFVGGANALGAEVFITDYETPVLLTLLFINTALISYYMLKLSRPSCRVSRRARR